LGKPRDAAGFFSRSLGPQAGEGVYAFRAVRLTRVAKRKSRRAWLAFASTGTHRWWNKIAQRAFPVQRNKVKETTMARAFILWLMGVPLFAVLLIWYFFF